MIEFDELEQMNGGLVLIGSDAISVNQIMFIFSVEMIDFITGKSVENRMCPENQIFFIK